MVLMVMLKLNHDCTDFTCTTTATTRWSSRCIKQLAKHGATLGLDDFLGHSAVAEKVLSYLLCFRALEQALHALFVSELARHSAPGN